MSLNQAENEKRAEAYVSQLLGFKEGDLSLCSKELYFLQMGSMKSSL